MQRLAEEAIRTEQNRARQLEIEERRRRREAADAQWAQEAKEQEQRRKEQAQRRKEQQQRDEESRAARTEQNRARQLEIEERRRRREAADARLQALLSHHAWDSSHNLARFDEPEGAQAELDELRAMADEKLVARVEARLDRAVRPVCAPRLCVLGIFCIWICMCVRRRSSRRLARACWLRRSCRRP